MGLADLLLAMFFLIAVILGMVIVELLVKSDLNKVRLENYDGYCRAFIYQSQVDAVLSNLAKELHEACTQEIGLQHTVTVERSECLLAESQRKITRAKEAFWKAHGLANLFGNVVKHSYKDYLPKPESSRTVREELPRGEN